MADFVGVGGSSCVGSSVDFRGGVGVVSLVGNWFVGGRPFVSASL